MRASSTQFNPLSRKDYNHDDNAVDTQSPQEFSNNAPINVNQPSLARGHAALDEAGLTVNDRLGRIASE